MARPVRQGLLRVRGVCAALALAGAGRAAPDRKILDIDKSGKTQTAGEEIVSRLKALGVPERK